MKQTFKIMLAAAVVALVLSFAPNASAQGIGMDLWGRVRRIIIVPPVQLTNGVAVGNTNGFPFTNNITGTDLRNYTGIAVLNVWSVNNLVTNTGGLGQQLTNILESSPDQTNWTAMANVAYSSNAVVNWTNTYYGGTNLVATNLYALPFTENTITPATAGYAGLFNGQSPTWSPMTNSGTWTANSGTNTFVAFNIDAMAGRYLRLRMQTGGQTTTNIIVGADLSAIPQQVGIP